MAEKEKEKQEKAGKKGPEPKKDAVKKEAKDKGCCG
jgi:hypothetical protein